MLCGSSARKLKRGASNLLAGRAIVKHMYPLTSAELNADLHPADVTCYGVFQGDRPVDIEAIKVFPVERFLAMLWQGEIIR